MNGTQVLQCRGLGNIGLTQGWQLAGAGLINNDNQPDLIFQNTLANTVSAWLITDQQIGKVSKPVYIGQADAGRLLVDTGPYTGTNTRSLVLFAPTNATASLWRLADAGNMDQTTEIQFA